MKTTPLNNQEAAPVRRSGTYFGLGTYLLSLIHI